MRSKTCKYCQIQSDHNSILKPVRTPVAILGSLGVCIYVPASRHIILSHPPELTRCDSVTGLAISAMSGHIQYRGAASGGLYIRISGINRVFFIIMFP